LRESIVFVRHSRHSTPSMELHMRLGSTAAPTLSLAVVVYFSVCCVCVALQQGLATGRTQGCAGFDAGCACTAAKPVSGCRDAFFMSAIVAVRRAEKQGSTRHAARRTNICVCELHRYLHVQSVRAVARARRVWRGPWRRPWGAWVGWAVGCRWRTLSIDAYRDDTSTVTL
jgi:hypothetical protein